MDGLRTIVVLPTYNERENVATMLAAVRRVVPDADVLVVDDSSPDGTAELVDELAAELGQVKLLRRPGKQGLGSAYREGFAIALDEGYDVVVSMDVDMSHDPEVLPDLLALVATGADAVIGSRYVPGGATVDWPLHRAPNVITTPHLGGATQQTAERAAAISAAEAVRFLNGEPLHHLANPEVLSGGSAAGSGGASSGGRRS